MQLLSRIPRLTAYFKANITSPEGDETTEETPAAADPSRAPAESTWPPTAGTPADLTLTPAATTGSQVVQGKSPGQLSDNKQDCLLMWLG